MMFRFVQQPDGPKLQGMTHPLQPVRPQVSAPVTFSFPLSALPKSSWGSITVPSVNSSSPSESRIAGVSIDGVNVPSVARCGKLFLPVRIVEKKILRPLLLRSPSVSSSINLPLLPSFYVTRKEATTLTANVVSDEGAYVAGVDLVVAFDDFRKFYEEIKTACLASETNVSTSCRGGWVQINNSVIPYVDMENSKYLPLSIVQNAAQLLTNVDPSALQVRQMSPADCQFLNDACRTAGLHFVVDSSTAVVDLLIVCSLSTRKPIVRYLPNEDPFGSAIFFDIPDTETRTDHDIERSSLTHSIGLQIIDVRGNAEPVVTQTSNLTKSISSTTSHHVTQPKPIIESISFRDRTVSSLRRADGKNYLLLEAICRVFFPSIAVDAFINCIEHVLRVPVSELTDDEQRYFIEFYQLPTNCLHCRKVVVVTDFEKFFPQIEYSFQSPCNGTTAVSSTLATGTDVKAPNVQAVSISQTAKATGCETPLTQSATTKAETKRSRKRVCSDVIVIDD